MPKIIMGEIVEIIGWVLIIIIGPVSIGFMYFMAYELFNIGFCFMGSLIGIIPTMVIIEIFYEIIS